MPPLLDPFGRVLHVPARVVASRRERVAMLVRVAEKLLESRDPADLYVGGALAAWLHGEDRCDLMRFLGITARGSHWSVQEVVRRIGREGRS